MKFKSLFIFLCFYAAAAAQPEPTLLFTLAYDELTLSERVENCGIYSIAGFDADADILVLSFWDSDKLLRIKGENMSRVEKKTGYKDVVINGNGMEVQPRQMRISEEPGEIAPLRLKKSYVDGRISVLKGDNGRIYGEHGETVEITVVSERLLNLKVHSSAADYTKQIIFPGDLAYAELVGIDAEGNLFLLVERFENHIPLKVKREIRVIGISGEEKALLHVPMIKYLSTIKDFTIDAEGNLYHLLTFQDRLEVVRWSGLTASSEEVINYTAQYDRYIHFNDYVTVDEFKGEEKPLDEPELVSSRLGALKTGDAYALHQFQASADNLAYTPVQAPDGDMVETPEWVLEGWNGRVPYKWGGFNTLSQYDAGLVSGKYAGDIHTSGVSGYAVGVDCSGFVSRCWGMSYHASTSYMPNITTLYADWNDLRPGDAIHKVGHVRLFIKREPNGSFKTVESTGRDWGVSYWNFTASDLSNYNPRYYDNMENDYNDQYPDLRTALFTGNNRVKLDWTCTGVDVEGYRLYHSIDNENWTLLKDETQLTATEIETGLTDSVNFFRVSSVLNSTRGGKESLWSYPLVVKKSASNKKLLIIDGFQRNSGSWRGYGNPFIARYGEVLSPHFYSVESIDDDYFFYENISMNDYDVVFWIAGDESSNDSTLTPQQQTVVKSYLEQGGNFYISGSEIGWDLVTQGNTADREFYENYLKADLIYDNANSERAIGVAGSHFAHLDFNFGQMYIEDYPDVIEPINGSHQIFQYHHDYSAAVAFYGTFGSGSVSGSMIYLGFPPETTADDEDFQLFVNAVLAYFESPTAGTGDEEILHSFSLAQNYPNPFNPSTLIRFTIPKAAQVNLTLYNQMGQEVAELLNGRLEGGEHTYSFTAENLASGVYFYRLTAEGYAETKKMLLLK